MTEDNGCMSAFRKTIVVIGSSTGGIRVLEQIFAGMPCLDGSIVIVQHMLKFANQSLCDKLDALTDMQVKLAENGQALEHGVVHFAPSEIHLEIVNNRTIRLFAGAKVNFVCPSIDVAMKSLQKGSGDRLVGAILTGMGADGAEGIDHIKRLGGVTLAQNKETSAIYGMPKVAFETGNVDFVLAPDEIRRKLIELVGVSADTV